MSGRRDLNPRPLAPHASALPGCATSRKTLPRQQTGHPPIYEHVEGSATDHDPSGSEN